MIPNHNKDTGYSYGVMDVGKEQTARDLGGEIWDNGTNESQEYALEEFRQRIQRYISDSVPDTGQTYEEDVRAFISACDLGGIDEGQAGEIYSDLVEGHGDTAKEAWDTIERLCFWDRYENEEEHFYYESTEGTQYRIGWLGGAPLIWVLGSAYVTPTRPCSPCVPGAGDLNTPVVDDEGNLCHCPGPADIDYEEMNFQVVYKIQDDASLKEVYRRTQQESVHED